MIVESFIVLVLILALLPPPLTVFDIEACVSLVSYATFSPKLSA